MNTSEFQFRFLEIAEQIEYASNQSPLNLKEILNYWNILLSSLLELKDEERNTVKILRALEQLHQLLAIEDRKTTLSKDIIQTLTKWLSIEIKLCSTDLSITETSPAKNSPSPLYWLGTGNELLELLDALWHSAKIGATPGLELSYTGFVRCFEDLFNIKIKKLFTKRGQVATRKRNPTPLLDYLKAIYLKNIENLNAGR